MGLGVRELFGPFAQGVKGLRNSIILALFLLLGTKLNGLKSLGFEGQQLKFNSSRFGVWFRVDPVDKQPAIEQLAVEPSSGKACRPDPETASAQETHR